MLLGELMERLLPYKLSNEVCLKMLSAYLGIEHSCPYELSNIILSEFYCHGVAVGSYHSRKLSLF